MPDAQSADIEQSMLRRGVDAISEDAVKVLS
jgi:hypothetical protein